MRYLTQKRAFTIVELIFVLVILGILAGTAIPKLTGIKDQAKKSAELASAHSIATRLEAIHGEWSINESNFDWDSDGITDDISNEFSSSGYPYDLGRNSDPIGAVIKSSTKSNFKIQVNQKKLSTMLFSIYTANASDPIIGVKFDDSKNRDVEGKPDRNDFWLYVIEANATNNGCFINSDNFNNTQVINGDFILIDVNGTNKLDYSRDDLGINFSVNCS